MKRRTPLEQFMFRDPAAARDLPVAPPTGPKLRNVDGDRMLRKCTVTVARRQKGSR